MPIAVRILYPENSEFKSNFINYGNRYIYDPTERENGYTTLAFKAELYYTEDPETPVIEATLVSFDISNDANFDTTFLTLDYTENYYYVLLPDVGSGSVTVDSEGSVPSGGSPPFLHPVLSDAEVELNIAEGGMVFVKNWPLSISEGEKTVYIRFTYELDGETYLYPSETDQYKGFYDKIIWQHSVPATPGKPYALNATANNYVSDNILYVYNKSQDLVAGVESYSVDLVKIAPEDIYEEFETSASYQEYTYNQAKTREENNLSVYKIRSDANEYSITLNVEDTSLTLESENTDDDPEYKGIEIAQFNRLSSKTLYTKINYDFSYISNESENSDQELFIIFKDFSDVYRKINSSGIIDLNVNITGTNSTGNIFVELPVESDPLFSNSTSAIGIQLQVNGAETITNDIWTTDESNYVNNINQYIPEVTSDNSFVSVAFSTKNGLTFATPDWIGETSIEQNFSNVPIPLQGDLEIFYTDLNDSFYYSDDIYITDADDSEQKFIVQEFVVSSPMIWENSSSPKGIEKIKIKIINNGNNSTEIISAVLAEINDIGIPINVDRSYYDYLTGYWNDVNTTKTIFRVSETLEADEEKEVTLIAQTYVENSISKTGISIYSGKKYVLILGLQTENGGDSNIKVRCIDENKFNSKRRKIEAISKHANFTNANYSSGGMKIREIYELQVENDKSPLAFQLLNNSSGVVYSSYNENNTSIITAFHKNRLEHKTNFKRIGMIQVPSLLMDEKTVTFGTRHKGIGEEHYASIKIYNHDTSETELIPDITVIKPEDLEFSEIEITDVIYSDVPTLNAANKWLKTYTGRYTVPTAEHIVDATKDILTSTQFYKGATSRKERILFESSIYTSQEGTEDLGGQTDQPTSGYDAWIGQDIFYESPTYDDNLQIDAEYYLNTIKDYDEEEIFFMLVTNRIYASMVDPYRNHVLDYSHPKDYVRVSINKDNSLLVYRNRIGNDEEELYCVIQDIETLVEEYIESETYYDTINRGKIRILLNNESDPNVSKITIKTYRQINETTFAWITLLDRYLDVKLKSETENGLYVISGSRVRNKTRTNSAFNFYNLYIAADDGTEINMSNESEIVLYNELQGLEYDERIVEYPNLLDLTPNAENPDYYQYTEHAYVVANNDTNCKMYVLAPQSVVLGDKEINWCDQVIDDATRAKCYGIVVTNIADESRSRGDTQRLTLVSTSSGNTGRDADPPDGDRREYIGPSGLTYAAVNSNKGITLLTNARAFSKKHWACSEWQWYEALTPWASNSSWIDMDNANIDPTVLTRMRESNPVTVDSLKDTKYTMTFSYELQDEAIDNNMEIYFGLGNFKPAYKSFNESTEERIVYQPETIADEKYYDISGDYWKKSIHDVAGVITGNQYAGFYDQDTLSTAWTFGESSDDGTDYNNPQNKYSVEGYLSIEGQAIPPDPEVTEEDYEIMLPFKKPTETDFNDEGFEPLSSSARRWFNVSFANDGKMYITRNLNGTTVKRIQITNEDASEEVITDFPKFGEITFEVERGTQTIDEGVHITATTNAIQINQTGSYDRLTLYYGTGPTRIKLVTVFTETTNLKTSIENDDYLEFLYPHIGIKEKYNTGVFECSLGEITISSAKENNIVPIAPEAVSWWFKKDGDYQDDDLIYGKQYIVGQCESQTGKLSINATYPHLAQSFVISSDNAYPDESYDISEDGTVKINSIVVRKTENEDDAPNQYWRCTIVEDDGDNEPDIGLSKSIYINTKTQKLYNRPNTDFNIYDKDVVALSMCPNCNQSKFLEFIFEEGVTLTVDTKYWIILTHPYIATSENTDVDPDYSQTYNYTLDSSTLSNEIINCSDSIDYMPPREIPDDRMLLWNVGRNSWELQNGILWFKIYKNYYINTKNSINDEEHKMRVSSYSYTHTHSESSDDANVITTDIIAPYNPDDSSEPPIIEDSGIESTVSKKKTLYISADDNGGSGIWRFRIGYINEKEELKYTTWYEWNDYDADDTVTVEWTYPGSNVGETHIFAEVQDKVGNLARSESINISIDAGFIIDTEPPYYSNVKIEGDATLEEDPEEASITNKDIVMVSMVALDETSGVKDYRINIDFETDGESELIYSPWQPMTPSFSYDLSDKDGRRSIAVQFRDFADNTVQPTIQETLLVDHISDNEIITSNMIEYLSFGKYCLYYCTSGIITKENLTGSTISYPGYSNYQLYRFTDEFSNIYYLNGNETTNVYVNDILVTEYTISTALNAIIFDEALSAEDTVTMDIREEVCRLYKFNGTVSKQLHKFSKEKERMCNCLCVYDEKIFMGFASGNIYTFNGVKISKVYTVKSGTTQLPISCMSVYQFSFETRPYLYIGTYYTPKVWQYGGNASITQYTWKEIETISNSSYEIDETTYYFDEQDHVLSIEGYDDYLFVGTGNNSIIVKYKKYLSEDGTEVLDEVESFTMLTKISSDFGGTQITSLRNFGNRIFAGNDDAAIFYYQHVNALQPKENEWYQITDFSTDFLYNTKPWSFYETPGRTNLDNSSTASIIANASETEYGVIDSYDLLIDCPIGKSSLLYQNSTLNSELFDEIDNEIGYTIEFECRRDSNSSTGSQEIIINDGTYQIELAIDNSTITLKNGNNSESVVSGSVDTGVETVVNTNFILTGDDADVNYYNLLPENTGGEEDYTEFKVAELAEGQYPYMEIEYSFIANADTYFEMAMKVMGFSYETTRFYVQWISSDSEVFNKERTYSISINNNFTPKTFRFNPGWNGRVVKIRILVEPTEDAIIALEYIRLSQITTSVFDVTENNKYRLTVKEQEVNLYINDSTKAMINKTDWLTEQTYDKSIAFGKCYQQHIASKTYWRGVRIYTEDAIPPNGTETIDWNLMALFAKGKTIVNMDIVGNSLIASVNPNESVFETDAIEDLNPKTYILKDENSTVWGDPEGTVDSVYPTEVAALTSTGTYDKVLYSGSDYQEELFLQNRFDKILLSEITSIDPDTGKIIWAEDLYGLGDLYQRRKANAFDEIIIDTKAPETNIVLKENDTSGGIRVREINVFAEAQ